MEGGGGRKPPSLPSLPLFLWQFGCRDGFRTKREISPFSISESDAALAEEDGLITQAAKKREEKKVREREPFRFWETL